MDKKLSINAVFLNFKYHVKPITDIAGMNELNIGHAIVSDSLFVGLEQAIHNMRHAMDGEI